MNEASWYKPAIESRTIITALVVIIMNLAALWGWTFDQTQVTAVVTSLVSIAGSAYIWYQRRYHTETRIKGILQAPTEKQDDRSPPQ